MADGEAPTSKAFRAVSLDGLPSAPTIEGLTSWRPVRGTLGIRGFGVNVYTASEGDEIIEAHRETDESTGGHEELYFVVRGAARFTVDGQDVDAPAATFVFVPEPGSRRQAVALEDDTAVLVVGGAPGAAFEVSAWEHLFRAIPLATAGDHEAAAQAVAGALPTHEDDPSVQYTMACYVALSGRADDAMRHLLRALREGGERTRRFAAQEPDFAALRERPDWPL